IHTFTSGSEMVAREYGVHILTRDGLDWSCFGSWNMRQMRFEIALCRRVAALDVSLDRRFGGLHTGIGSCRPKPSRRSESPPPPPARPAPARSLPGLRRNA